MAVSLVSLGLFSEVHLQDTAVLPTAEEHVRRVGLQGNLHTHSSIVGGGRERERGVGEEGGEKKFNIDSPP